MDSKRNSQVHLFAKNLLLEKPEYKIEKTRLGIWRRHFSMSGIYFAEFKSHLTLFGLPLIHYTRGKSPETGTLVVAKGILAIGRIALGLIAIGQASFGIIAVGQLAVSLLFGIGQACTGIFAFGQLAIGLLLGMGQLATGAIAIGQLAVGKYVLAQAGFGEYIWTQKAADPQAVEFFQPLVHRLLGR